MGLDNIISLFHELALMHIEHVGGCHEQIRRHLSTSECSSKIQLGFSFEQGIKFRIFYPHQSSNMVQLVIS